MLYRLNTSLSLYAKANKACDTKPCYIKKTMDSSQMSYSRSQPFAFGVTGGAGCLYNGSCTLLWSDQRTFSDQKLIIELK